MRKAALMMLFFLLISGVVAQSGVRAVVVNEFANIRIIPAIGADVITTVEAGYEFANVTGRTGDNTWIRIDFNGEEGWVNLAPLIILEGDVNLLPVADPRTIPYGGQETPRAGLSSATSNITGRLPNSGVRVRSGPSTGYPVLADAPRYTVMPVLGRTASSTWVQVNFEGTLGWVASRYVDVSVPLGQLPIDGVIAESAPIDRAIAEDYISTLRLMRARLDLAQPSLDAIRAMWTDAALAGRANCRPYPTRPSDYNIPQPLFAAYFNNLNPLITIFNDAMFNVRRSIDLFIEVCEQPGLNNPVGQATAIGALDTVSLADSQFADLRRRLDELIPPEREIGEDECLFSFQNEAEILPVIGLDQLIRDDFNPRRIVTGYCIDLLAGQSIIIETLQLGNSNITHQVNISRLDNPTNFEGIGRGTEGDPTLRLGPVPISEGGRYLIVLSDIALERTGPIGGDFAMIVYVPVSLVSNRLQENPATGEVIVAPVTSPTQQPFFPTVTPGGSGSLPPFILTQQAQQAQSPNNNNEGITSPVVCPGISLTCDQLVTCEQAYACLRDGNFGLDPDADNVPCEAVLCPATP